MHCNLFQIKLSAIQIYCCNNILQLWWIDAQIFCTSWLYTSFDKDKLKLEDIYLNQASKGRDGHHLAVLESEGVGLLWSPDRTKQNILGERTSCRTTYTRYRIRIVWTLLGKSISTISTTSITAKYAGVQMGWHRFKIVLSSPRMQPWIPGRH